MEQMQRILSGLNERQREAVTTTEGYVRVIAGAGSGKTKTLTCRYSYIVKHLGIDPANILCVTFTNKAAQEMKKRIRRDIGEDYDTGLITTYHGFCVRVLRQDIHHFYYPKDFIILDEEDQNAILREIYEELGLSSREYTFNDIRRNISKWKMNLGYVRTLGSLDAQLDIDGAKTTIEKIIMMYARKQKRVYGLDFDDLINFTFVLFEDRKSVV